MGAFQFINRLVGAVLLGDVGHEVKDTARVAPLVIVPDRALEAYSECRKVGKTYQETSLMKLSLRAIPALASKMEEAGLPLRSEETSSSSE
jgi:hypothetical protein